MPSYFLAIQDQLDRVRQIATVAEIVTPPSDTLIAQLNTQFALVDAYQPFTADEYTFLTAKVVELNAVDARVVADGDVAAQRQKEIDLQTVYKEVTAQISNDRFVNAFTQANTMFKNLRTLLNTSFTSFSNIHNMVMAIKVLQALVLSTPAPPLAVLVSTVQAIRGPTIAQGDVLDMIAVFTAYTGDSYEGNDLVALRNKYPAVQRAQWIQYLDANIAAMNAGDPS